MSKAPHLPAQSLATLVIKGLQEKKAEDIVRMDLRELPGAVTEYFVIASGTSDRHVQALADSVEDVVKKACGERPLNREGMQLGEWVLLDYVNVVVHIFLPEKRQFFRLERLWGDARIEPVTEMVA